MKALARFSIAAFWLIAGLCPLGHATTPSLPASPVEAEPALTADRIEADWLVENAVRGVPAAPGGSVTPEEDAAGGCDGVINGRWGFHTALEENPWWQVDLKRVMPLDQVHVYNRCDETAARAAELMLLVSEDGEHFEQVYQHDGSTFYGHSDGKPLIVVLGGRKARFLRIQLPGLTCLHLDEVEVYEQTFYTDWNTGTQTDAATQSSTCEHSTRSLPAHSMGPPMLPTTRPAEGYATATALERGLLLAADLRQRGVDVTAEAQTLKEVALRLRQPEEASQEVRKELYLRVRGAVRRMSLANPLLDFDDLLLVKRRHSSYSHMSDQYYGWFSRDGGGLYVLENFKSESARLRLLTGSLPPGDVLRPDLSHDGRKALFAYAKFHPGLCDEPNKLDKANVPEDAFYHLYEINLDGTGLRQLTRGKYDDFDGRYLPGGEIIFLSTRRGQHIQCGKASATATLEGTLPDGYVRCGGGPERPVAVYTLHRMEADGGNLRQISAFEEFEWTPSIDHDGRILYARWDYVDRSGQPYMSLWSTLPDGTQPQSVFGNYAQKPLATFEPRSIPGSRKVVFTASGHHSVTGGSLVLLDPAKGDDGRNPITRLTPEVPFPEIEGWPGTFYANPYPLSEDYYLVAWSNRPLSHAVGPSDGLGVYLSDAFGNLTLLYRDPAISSMSPLPIRPQEPPKHLAARVDWEGAQEGRMLLLDVHEGLPASLRGTVRRLRLVGIPPKTHPVMNNPPMGMTRDDPGKFVLGTVPVEADGSAYFRMPSGVNFFMQALDERGMAVQTMRTVTYVQPGETTTCVGCHEPRHTSPPNVVPLALGREPSKITPGPEGSWPLDYQTLVQPVLQSQCVECHQPGAKDPDFDLTAEKSYDALTGYGRPSLRDHVVAQFRQARSTPGDCASATSPLLKLLGEGHYDVKLGPGDEARLITWMDTYGQRLGSFGKEQEERLRQFRRETAALLAE